MKLKEFIECLQSIEEETGSHPSLDGALDFVLEDEDEDLEIKEVDVIRTFGCGCWIGARVILKRLESKGKGLSHDSSATKL